MIPGPSDDLVERCAQASFGVAVRDRRRTSVHVATWDMISAYWKRIYRDQTRAVLTEAAPEMIAAARAAERERIALSIEADMNRDAVRNATLARAAHLARQEPGPG